MAKTLPANPLLWLADNAVRTGTLAMYCRMDRACPKPSNPAACRAGSSDARAGQPCVNTVRMQGTGHSSIRWPGGMKRDEVALKNRFAAKHPIGTLPMGCFLWLHRVMRFTVGNTTGPRLDDAPGTQCNRHGGGSCWGTDTEQAPLRAWRAARAGYFPLAGVQSNHRLEPGRR